ncbi:alpha/beta fold hydrolase [Leifsonia shinshuensis]|uniref:alpha/beta hydrolase n=1 Tax=Leifsonia shinshuensis TaxID=150026 RepID=UPI0028630EFF|nr:alpha/beta fold hydrolase [Leifsonia shinshuensis]MDR6972910.1 pimeloyl-ACP methyl ester carboxylesterase [Leifsonia shinshuensis]
MNSDQLRNRIVGGVALTECSAEEPLARTPLVFVHGGLHGSWQWAQSQRWFLAAGRSSAALDWYNHGTSQALDTVAWLDRGITDVRTEIGVAVEQAGTAPVLVGHSMGGLASLAYAAAHPDTIAALVLLTPVVPSQFAGATIELPVDLSAPWGPPPPPVAQRLFYDGAPEREWGEIYAQLQPESPRAVWEATRWTAEVDTGTVTMPTLVVAAQQDELCPADVVSSLARGLGAELITLAHSGHGVTFGLAWAELQERIENWISDVLGEPTR